MGLGTSKPTNVSRRQLLCGGVASQNTSRPETYCLKYALHLLIIRAAVGVTTVGLGTGNVSTTSTVRSDRNIKLRSYAIRWRRWLKSSRPTVLRVKREVEDAALGVSKRGDSKVRNGFESLAVLRRLRRPRCPR